MLFTATWAFLEDSNSIRGRCRLFPSSRQFISIAEWNTDCHCASSLFLMFRDYLLPFVSSPSLSDSLCVLCCGSDALLSLFLPALLLLISWDTCNPSTHQPNSTLTLFFLAIHHQAFVTASLVVRTLDSRPFEMVFFKFSLLCCLAFPVPNDHQLISCVPVHLPSCWSLIQPYSLPCSLQLLSPCSSFSQSFAFTCFLPCLFPFLLVGHIPLFL